MRPDQVGVDAGANAILLSNANAIKASAVEIRNARHEGKAKRMAECENEIADAAAIHMMTNDVETRVGFEKPSRTWTASLAVAAMIFVWNGDYRPEIAV